MSASTASWTSFLKSMALFNGDLSSLTAPPFILSPTSLVEFSQYWSEHPDLLIDPISLSTDEDASAVEKEAMALKRMISVTRWFILTLRSQYCSRNESMGLEKKPLNPFLGEVFVGKWASEKDGETVLLSEQVSHHPPVTAYTILNEKNGVQLQGYNGVRSYFSTTSLNIKQHGHALLTYSSLKESYLVTLPPLHIEGLMQASPYVELDGSSYIQSSNGYIAVIDYSGKGYFSGKKHTFKARIYKDEFSSAKKENALVTISGQWADKSYIAKGLEASKDELFYDALTQPKNELIVKPIVDQHALESRKAWEKVGVAIKSANNTLINAEKSIIENAQRELRQEEEEAGIKWEQRWFELKDYEDGEPDTFTALAGLANLSICNGPSGSAKLGKYDQGDMKHWRVDLAKWKKEKEIKV